MKGKLMNEIFEEMDSAVEVFFSAIDQMKVGA
jgi:hypothetical protein